VKRHLRSLVLATAAIFVSANSAKACLWDTTVVGHEKQFKSSYLEQPNVTPQEPSLIQQAGASIGIVGGLGLVMLMGAMWIGVIRHREAAKKTSVG